MLPTRCISPPCENMLVNSVAVEGTRASSPANSTSPKKHSWNEAEAQRIGLAFIRSQRELNQQINRRADSDDGERCQWWPVTARVIVSIGKEHLVAMSLSLLKFVGQASLVDDAMLPS